MTTSIYLGTQGWSYKSWVGPFYPERTPQNEFLPEYARRFGAVEIDSTFYGTPQPQTVKKWYDVTPADFKFTAKFPQSITHDKMLQGVEHETAHFLATMNLLGDKLGPLLLQFPYNFRPDRREILAQFLAALPQDLRYAIEVRHRGWLNQAFFDLLEKHRVALALTDSTHMPALQRVTTDFTYVRWLGNRSDVPEGEYDHVRVARDQDLVHWSQFMNNALNDEVTVWGFANNHYQGHSPATIRAFMELLGVPQRVPVHTTQPHLDPKERRASPRVDATYRIAYECFNSWGVKVDEGPAKTVDISGRGALIEIQRGVPLDASMVLLVMAPFHMLMVKGSVVHSRRADNGAFHVGVKLTEVIEGTWEVLNWVIKERRAEKAEWTDMHG